MNERGGSIDFIGKPNIEPTKIIQLVQQQSQIYRLQGSQRLTFNLVSTTVAQRFSMLNKLLQALG